MAIQIRAQLRAELRRRYARLRAIPGPRWRSVEGQHFLRELHLHVERYGQRQIAEALQVSHQAVSQMLRRYEPAELFGSARTQATLRQLWAAHVHVRAWRDLGRQVRRHHTSYLAMFTAVEELAMVYPIPTIAKLSGIRAQELQRFMTEPDRTTYDDVALLALLEAYEDGRALTGPRRRAFLTQLEETLASHALVDVARLLRVPPRVMRTWMVERTHGQHPEELADPRAGHRGGGDGRT